MAVTQSTRTFRIFVSSTFSDLKAERNALQKNVFPRLRELCAAHGARFQAIDLRWGVSEETSLDQQTMRICLEEIARCQQVTSRPNFIVLLGDRYGWRPLPPEIPFNEFEQIIQQVSKKDKALLAQWYWRDDNADPAIYVLQPRQPELGSIPSADFERLLDVDDPNLKSKYELLKQWYKPGQVKGAISPQYFGTTCQDRTVYILQPFIEHDSEKKKERSEAAQIVENFFWQTIETHIHAILERTATDFPNEIQLKYTASATEQEVERGIFNVPNPTESALCFFRTIKDLPQGKEAGKFLDLDATEEKPDGEARERLERLKDKLRRLLPGNDEYEAGWANGGITSDHIGTLPEKLEDCLKLIEDDKVPSSLCVDVWRRLSRIILAEIAQLEEVDPLDAEIAAHEAFGVERARHFTGRAAMLQAIGEYVGGGNQHPLAVWGESGCGKSALMAKAVQQAQEAHSNAKVVYRFIGATPDSSSGRALLDSLCQEIYRLFNFDKQKRKRLSEIEDTDPSAPEKRQRIEEEYSIPIEFQNLSATFLNFLNKIPTEEGLILFLDALDQLSDADNARRLTCLPAELPEHVHLIVSTLPGECLSALERKLPEVNRIELKPMSLNEGSELLRLWFDDTGRTLRDDQRKKVLDKFAGCGLPLYLKLAFEEARRWKSYTEKTELSPDIPGVTRDLFARLTLDVNHGKMLVSRSLGYLAAAKNGLSEDEMLDVLSRDMGLYAWFFESIYHTPRDLLECAKEYLENTPSSRSPGKGAVDDKAVEEWLDGLRQDRARLLDFLSTILGKPGGPRLPVVLWSRLYFDLRPYLTEHAADGASLLAFYHRQLSEVSAASYLAEGDKPALHSRLADYFEVQPLFYTESDDRRLPDLRKLAEFPYHLTLAGDNDSWEKLEHTICNMEFVEMKVRAGMVYELEEDYRRALEELPEAENIKQAAERQRERQAAWIRDLVEYSRAYSPIRATECNLRTRHTDANKPSLPRPPTAVQPLQGKKRDVVMEDSECESRLQRFQAFSDFVSTERSSLMTNGKRPFFTTQQAYNSAKNSPVSKQAANLLQSISEIPLITVHPAWRRQHHPDATPLVVYEHTGENRCFAMTPDMRYLVYSDYRMSYLLDMVTWKVVDTLAEGGVSIDITPDGGLAVLAGRDENKTLLVWDLRTNRLIHAVQSPSAIAAVAVIPDGSMAVTASADKTVCVWDTRRGTILDQLSGHDDVVTDIAISVDGRYAVSGSRDKTVRVWDLRKRQCVTTFVTGHFSVNVVCISYNNRHVLAGTSGGMYLWDLSEEELICKFQMDNQVSAVSITPDGTMATCVVSRLGLVLCSLAWKQTLYNFVSGDIVKGCQISADGSFAFGTSSRRSERGQILRWNLERGMSSLPPGYSSEFLGSSDSIPSISQMEPLGLCAAGRDIHVWNLEQASRVGILKGHGGTVEHVFISPDSEGAFSTDDQRAMVWDLNRMERAEIIDGYVEITTSLDGRYSSVLSLNQLAIIDLTTGADIRVLRGERGEVWWSFPSIAPDNRFVLVYKLGGDEGSCVMLWDLYRDTPVRIVHEPSLEALAVSPDWSLFVTDRLDVCNLARTERVKELVPSTIHESVSFTPEGRHLISCGRDRVCLWSIKTGECCAEYDYKRTVWSGSSINQKGQFLMTGAYELLLLELRNVVDKYPVVTPVVRWLFDPRSGSGRWDCAITANCVYCRKDFEVQHGIIEFIQSLAREYGLTDEDSPCLKLDEAVWQDQVLATNCPNCRKRLKVNPFIVDNRQRYGERRISLLGKHVAGGNWVEQRQIME